MNFNQRRGSRPTPSQFLHAIGEGLRRRSPRIYRFVKPAWYRAEQCVRRLLSKPGYWESRRDYAYYKEVVRFARLYVPKGRSVIDVGAGQTQVLRELDWFDRRVSLDVTYRPSQRGIERIEADFMEYRANETFDLVLCLQVLEHLDAPGPFARKLLSLGRTTIISVPYRWPAGDYPPHVQDPVDEVKLEAWTCRKPTAMSIVADHGSERLIAVYADV